MTRLGTWTTIDSPTKKVEQALEFLQEEFGEIGGTVRKVSNPHDFGNYPSFEVDYPYSLEYIDDTDCCCADCKECEDIMKKEDWQDKANAIDSKYSEKFENYL